MEMENLNQLSLEDIVLRLRQSDPHTILYAPFDLDSSKHCREAAVLIPLLRIGDEWHLLYIRRSTSPHDRHSGQVAFAGGKREANDRSLIDTALREAEEEIGLMRQDVQVLGQLENHYSVSLFNITPVIATVNWPYHLRLQEAEVSRAFTMPLQWLAVPDNHEIRYLERQGKRIPVAYFREYDGELLWGATARMTLSLTQILARSTHTTRADYGTDHRIRQGV